MIGLLADVNAQGHFELLYSLMQAPPWIEFTSAPDVQLLSFDEIGLARDASDLEIWQLCQAEELILLTNNRNHESPDSLEATIRRLNTPDSLPVFTIADLWQFRRDRDYGQLVVERLLQYLLKLDLVKGAGRLYLP